MDSPAVWLETKIRFSLRVGKHRAIPNQRPQQTRLLAAIITVTAAAYIKHLVYLYNTVKDI